MNKAREINKLRVRLKSKRGEIETEIGKIQAVIDKPGVEEFNETEANETVAAAMIADAVDGQKTADVVEADMGRNRIQTESARGKRRDEVQKAEKAMAIQQTALTAIDDQILTVQGELKEAMKAASLAALEMAKQDYVEAADDMFDKLTRVNAILSQLGPNAASYFQKNRITIPSAESKGFKRFGVGFSGAQTATSQNPNELLQAESDKFLVEILGENHGY